MAVATKEIVMDPKVEETKTLETQADRPASKEYHYMQRTVGLMATNDPIITGDMLDADVMDWLNRGYTLMAVHYLGQATDKGSNKVPGYMYGYHFIKG